MNKIFIIISITFPLVPSMAYAQSEQMVLKTPPAVSQPLVPEGNFALRFVSALKLGTTDSEAQAEDIFLSARISPKNGWITDYLVTPDERKRRSFDPLFLSRTTLLAAVFH